MILQIRHPEMVDPRSSGRDFDNDLHLLQKSTATMRHRKAYGGREFATRRDVPSYRGPSHTGYSSPATVLGQPLAMRAAACRCWLGGLIHVNKQRPASRPPRAGVALATASPPSAPSQARECTRP